MTESNPSPQDRPAASDPGSPGQSADAEPAPRKGLAQLLPDAPVATSGAEELANRLRWTSGSSNHYEVWYITLSEGPGGAGFWFRYTIHVPPSGSGPGVCSLWGFICDPAVSETPVGVRQSWPLDAFQARTSPFGVAVGDAGSFDGRRARGAVTAPGGRRIAWDFELSASEGVHHHFSEAWHRWGVAKTCVNSPNLAARADGWVRLDEREWQLRGVSADQSHVFGSRHAWHWVWSHCHGFDEDRDAVFEVVRGRIRKLGMVLPPATLLLLRQAGLSHCVDGLWGAARVSSTAEHGRLWLEAQAGNHLIRAEVTAPPERTIVAPYHDPDGTELWCHSCLTADASVEVCRRVGGGYETLARLTANGTATLEVGSRDRDPRVERELEVAPAPTG